MPRKKENEEIENKVQEDKKEKTRTTVKKTKKEKVEDIVKEEENRKEETEDNIQEYQKEKTSTEIVEGPITNKQRIEPMTNNNMYNYSTQNKKSGNKLGVVLLILFVLCVVGVAWFILGKYVIEKGQEVIEKTKNNNSNSNVELKYTETSKVSEGVYITDVSEVVENVMPSIVAITSKTLVSSGQYGPNFFGKNQYTTGAGSGIIVSKTEKELMILTNNHVIEGAESLSVQFINNKSVDAKIKGTSTSRDVAIITVNLSDLDKETINSIKIASMGDSNDLKVGNGVIAIGNALGYGQSVTTGVISALNREVNIDGNAMNMIQIDAAINGGNSGGALLNSKGEVIGINSVKYSSSGYSSSASIEGMGFAIPISDVSDLITRLMNGENLSDKERGYLGVSGYIVTEDYSEAYNIPRGFYISSIVEGSGADKANLEIGNIITEIDGKKVTQFIDMSEVLEIKKAQEKVKLKVKYISGREYKEKNIEVTLSSYSEVN